MPRVQSCPSLRAWFCTSYIYIYIGKQSHSCEEHFPPGDPRARHDDDEDDSLGSHRRTLAESSEMLQESAMAMWYCRLLITCLSSCLESLAGVGIPGDFSQKLGWPSRLPRSKMRFEICEAASTEHKAQRPDHCLGAAHFLNHCCIVGQDVSHSWPHGATVSFKPALLRQDPDRHWKFCRAICTYPYMQSRTDGWCNT